MAKEILEISKGIKQKFNYKSLNEMYEKTQLEIQDRQTIFEKTKDQYSNEVTEKIIFYVANFKFIEQEKIMLEFLTEKMKKGGLVMASLTELAFFDNDPSFFRKIKNFFTNGHKTGTLGHFREGRFNEKCYPVKKLKPMSNHPISYHQFFKFSDGEFNILLKEGELTKEIKKTDAVSDNEKVLDHEKRKFNKTERYKVPEHIVQI